MLMIKNFFFLALGLNSLMQADKYQRLGFIRLGDGFKSGKSMISDL